jgi:hypothetical protein
MGTSQATLDAQKAADQQYQNAQTSVLIDKARSDIVTLIQTQNDKNMSDIMASVSTRCAETGKCLDSGVATQNFVLGEINKLRQYVDAQNVAGQAYADNILKQSKLYTDTSISTLDNYIKSEIVRLSSYVDSNMPLWKKYTCNIVDSAGVAKKIGTIDSSANSASYFTMGKMCVVYYHFRQTSGNINGKSTTAYKEHYFTLPPGVTIDISIRMAARGGTHPFDFPPCGTAFAGVVGSTLSEYGTGITFPLNKTAYGMMIARSSNKAGADSWSTGFAPVSDLWFSLSVPLSFMANSIFPIL